MTHGWSWINPKDSWQIWSRVSEPQSYKELCSSQMQHDFCGIFCPGVLFWSCMMSLHTPAGLVSGLKWPQTPHWFCVAPEASTPCQFLSIHNTPSSVSLIGSPPISKIPQPHRNWLPFSHPANAIVQVHSVSLWMRWSLTHEFWDKRPMCCLSTSFLNRNYISANNNHNAL